MGRGTLREVLSAGIETIHSVTFPGGEPSLPTGLRAIRWFMEECRHRSINVDNFYIATNGKVYRKEFIDTIRDLFWFCGDNEISGVDFSNDSYHDEINNHLYYKLQDLSEMELVDNWGHHLSIEKRIKDTTARSLVLDQGRAKGWGDREVEPDALQWEEHDYNTYVSEGSIYLNCLGNVINGCDWSYSEQNHPSNILCRAADFSEDVIRQKVELTN